MGDIISVHKTIFIFLIQSEDSALEQGLFLSSPQSQTEGGAPILLQLLEFKTHLQEVVEELHIRRVI